LQYQGVINAPSSRFRGLMVRRRLLIRSR
jgi:hypothetical protein